MTVDKELKGVTLRIDAELHKRLKLHAVKQELTIQDYLKKLLMEDLEKNERE